jgi:hypothetical protein
MQRRSFLQATAAAGGLMTLPLLHAAAAESAGREFFELRSYTLRPGKRALLDAYFQHALIPALNRQGVNPVGVFYENPDAETPLSYFLARYKSLAEMTAVATALASDAEYHAAAKDYLSAPATDAVYDRIESSLLRGIDGMPGLAAPALKPRLLNLRIYESHNEAASQKKIEMFNRGELDIFRRVGLTPVLFGEALVGARLPNLTYLLVFDDDTTRQEAWNRFRTDPEWVTLKAIPEYEDKKIVSKITNKILTPAAYSQI